MFIGRIYAGKRLRFESPAFETRQDAAQACFDAVKTARTCSTSEARMVDGRVVNTHCDIRWHDRNR